MSVRVGDVIEPMNDLTTFPVAYGKDVWLDKNKSSGTPDYATLQSMYNTGDLGGGGSSIQVETMPAASAENVGKIVQYVGETGTYQKGHFYECVHNKCDVLQPVYKWIDVSSYRYNHVVYNQTTEPINSDFIAGDIIYYTGVLTDKFKPNHYYRALPSIGTMEKYTFTMYRSTYGGMVFWSYTPFEFRQGFIVYPTGGGGEWEPYEITSITDEKVTITPYGDWGGEPLEFDGVLYTSEVKDWEELEGGGGTSIFYGTMDEWNALSADEKKQYDYMTDDQNGSEDNGEWKTAWTGSVSLPSTDGQETTIISGLSIANAKRIAIKLGSNQGNRIPDIAIVEHLIGVTNIGSASVCYLGDAEYYCCASFKVDFSNGTIRGNFISYKWAFTNTVVGVYWQ